MSWTKPDFEELALCMEVTAYVNTEDELPLPIGGEQHHPSATAIVENQSGQENE